jgi:hypothetical protein
VAGDHPELAPGGTLRFGVEDPATGLRSAQYRAWSTKTTDDVYVAGRDAGGWIKVSLHQSGQWQHGFTRNAENDGWVSDPGASRHFQRWPRPPELAPGITLALRILVPTSQLRPGPASRSKDRPSCTVPPPPNAPAVSFDLYLVAADAPVVQFQQAAPVGSLRLPSGTVAQVVALPTQLGGNPEEVFQPELAEARQAALTADLADLPADLHPRIVLHMLDDDLQTLKLIEMALDLPSAARHA